MNDEELRAFLESATVGDDDGATDHEDDAHESDTGDIASAPVVDAAPRRVAPSFDELMNMPDPKAAPAPAQSGPETPPVQRPAANSIATSVPMDPVPPVVTPEPKASSASENKEWSQAYAQDNEQLVPLILPGFSSTPRPARELPPVFRADPVAPKAPETQHVDPAPTQPFDLLSESQRADPKGSSASPAAGPADTATSAGSGPAPHLADAASSTASARSVPISSGFTGSAPAESRLDRDQPGENPFALLAPELADSEPAEDEYEKISVTGGPPRDRKALPWLIVGGGAVIAIIASIFVINGVRGNDMPAPPEQPAVTGEPAPSETDPPKPKPKPSEEPAPEPTTAPVVDPGSTWSLRIDQWGIAVEVSEKLGGSTPYTLFDGNSRAMFDSIPVAAGFSDSCAAARAEHAWGLLKNDDGTLEVIRPEPRCTSPTDAAVYDTIWGVMEYMAKSAKPA